MVSGVVNFVGVIIINFFIAFIFVVAVHPTLVAIVTIITIISINNDPNQHFPK